MYLNIQSLPHSKYTLQIEYEKQLGNAVYENVAPFSEPSKIHKRTLQEKYRFFLIVRSCGARS